MKNQIKKIAGEKVARKNALIRSSGKHPGGRPSKYNDEVLKASMDYINNYSKHGDTIPSISGLAVILGVRRETLHVWANEESKKEFSNILGTILAKQENILINKGLSGDFNPTIAKLVLGKHGYHDRQDNTLIGADGTPMDTSITIEFVVPK